MRRKRMRAVAHRNAMAQKLGHPGMNVPGVQPTAYAGGQTNYNGPQVGGAGYAYGGPPHNYAPPPHAPPTHQTSAQYATGENRFRNDPPAPPPYIEGEQGQKQSSGPMTPVAPAAAHTIHNEDQNPPFVGGFRPPNSPPHNTNV
ncbi:hypothetical protein FA15DRAFT_69943 [Coprinopsis marcescibilis]|uniref:Uncharacterized protein n=1 Tax=Coprinopsis marcescibilis TaxID=230819 RepID=A0A5C3KN23_COPMA|nr:hypothetical protein FA15DRAFT_69943 [Coprinopsis marcescibilis]